MSSPLIWDLNSIKAFLYFYVRTAIERLHRTAWDSRRTRFCHTQQVPLRQLDRQSLVRPAGRTSRTPRLFLSLFALPLGRNKPTPYNDVGSGINTDSSGSRQQLASADHVMFTPIGYFQISAVQQNAWQYDRIVPELNKQMYQMRYFCSRRFFFFLWPSYRGKQEKMQRRKTCQWRAVPSSWLKALFNLQCNYSNNVSMHSKPLTKLHQSIPMAILLTMGNLRRSSTNTIRQ